MKKILVADDQEYSRYLLETILTGSGYEVASACNGGEAWERLQQGDIDMVLTDILMPVMDGFTLCRRIRASDTLKNTPVVFYTATYTDERDEELAMRMGADAFLRKPLDPQSLVDSVESVFSQRRGRAPQMAVGESLNGDVLELYNERLIKKLEKKLVELEDERARRGSVIAELQRKNRSLRMINECTSAIMRSATEQKICSGIMKSVVDIGAYRFAWIATTEGQPGSGLVPRAAYGGAGEGLDVVPEVCFTAEVSKVCPIVEALSSRELAVRRPPWEGLCRAVADNAVRMGYGMEIALPLVAADETLGVMVLYADDAVVLDAEETILLKELADNTAFGIASARNALERARAEKMLAKSEERFRLIAETSPDTLFLLTPEGRIDYLSPASERMLGVAPRSIAGARFTDLVVEHDREEALGALERVMGGETLRGREFGMRLPDGRNLFVEVSAAPVREGGKVSAVLGVARDVTARRELERQLLQSQKMEVLGSLAGGIAHDFNNILSAIVGYTELMLQRAETGSELERDLNSILNACMRARDLIRSILAMSRHAPHGAERVAVKDVVKDALKLLRATIPANITFETDIGTDAAVMVDPVNIHQVVLNLVTNAAHAIGSRGGKIRIGLDETDLGPDNAAVSGASVPAGRYVRLVVEDTGTGIDPSILPHIFKPFFTTRQGQGGTGLGLFMVQTLARECGGHVHVQTEPGKGTCFTVILPVAPEHAPIGSLEPEQDVPRGSERILFVDDEKSITYISREMLSDLGYTVTPAAGSVEALEIFRQSPNDFDLVVTDLAMPIMSGLELAREIRATRSDIPVILSTGTHDSDVAAQAKKLGVSGFIAKPFKKAELARAVREILDRAKG